MSASGARALDHAKKRESDEGSTGSLYFKLPVLQQLTVLTYLSTTHQLNPEAEISGRELQHELGLDAETVRVCVAELARQGLVEFDPLLSNIWLRITDKGLMVAERGMNGPL